METKTNALSGSISSLTNRNAYIDAAVIYSLFLAFGFPGKWAELFPSSFQTILEYSAFILQIILMLMYEEQTVRNVGDIKIISTKNKYIGIYLMIFVFFFQSMLVTKFPKEEAISCIRFTVTAFFVLWMVDRYDTKILLELLFYGQCLFLLMTFILFVIRNDLCYSYEFNGLPSFCGLYDRKNSCAAEIAAGLTIQVALLKIKRIRKESVSFGFVIILVVQIVLLIYSRATGALLSAIAACGYILYWNDKKPKINIGFLYTAISAAFPFFFLTILKILEPFLNMIGKDVTLTNRTTMWPVFIDIMLKTHTLTGFGFNMFWRDPEAISIYHERFQSDSWFANMTTGAHNTVLELWLNVGLIGLAAFFLMFLISFRNIKKADAQIYTVCTGFTILLLFRGLTERSITPNNYQTIMMFLAAAIASSIVLEKEDRREVQIYHES